MGLLNKQHALLNTEDTPITGFIDEESLLPGAIEAKDFKGYLDIMDSNNNVQIKMKPLIEQDQLINLQLKSHNYPLYYTLNDEKNEITATQGANGPLVFNASIANDGFYNFTLYNTIDRETQPNLIINGNFENKKHIKKNDTNYLTIPGWTISKHINVSDTYTEYNQEISAKKDHLHQVTFYYMPNKTNLNQLHPIDIFWNDIKLITLDQNKTESRGYTFSVFGNEKDSSKLKLICHNEEQINQVISNISVISREQSIVPIMLAISIIEENNVITDSSIKINVTTTPPLELDNQLPMEVIFEQSVYQTIVINDEYTGNDPFAKINLDSIFESLEIPGNDRLVQIVQREAEGEPTNVYEIQITDREQAFSPITVADVQLSFPGGDAGLSIFLKNIEIDHG